MCSACPVLKDKREAIFGFIVEEEKAGFYAGFFYIVEELTFANCDPAVVTPPGIAALPGSRGLVDLPTPVGVGFCDGVGTRREHNGLVT